MCANELMCLQCIPMRLAILSNEREAGALHAIVQQGDGVNYYTGIIRAQKGRKSKGRIPLPNSRLDYWFCRISTKDEKYRMGIEGSAYGQLLQSFTLRMVHPPHTTQILQILLKTVLI